MFCSLPFSTSSFLVLVPAALLRIIIIFRDEGEMLCSLPFIPFILNTAGKESE
jgi:hypothetical protein